MIGSPWAFLFALSLILIWFVAGFVFGFTDTHQLLINTGTTIITFLMVFLIQNTQNRDAKALHLKLDELLRALQEPRNEMINIENLSDDELKKLESEFQEMRKQL